MRAIEWHRCLESQRELYGKTVLSITELCHLSGTHNLLSMKVQAGRLVKAGVLQRCAIGKYSLPGAADPESLLPYLDSCAYMTGLYALSRHNMITQIPTQITCFTNRRHNLARIRPTAVGVFRFICVSPRFYARPQEKLLASPDQAICDWVLALRHRGLLPAGQVTLRLAGKLKPDQLRKHIQRYPATVRQTVLELLP